MKSYTAKITSDQRNPVREIKGKANSCQEFHKDILWKLNDSEEILEILNNRGNTVYHIKKGFIGR